ncbi:MAG: type II toxin-antitoxin system HipA family toxin [Rhodospirillales bacterium]
MPTLNNAVEVQLWDKRAGAAAWDDERGCASFRYDDEFIESGLEIAPVMMPLSEEIYQFDDLQERPYLGLPGLLADSLPDKFGNQLINGWFARRGFGQDDFSPIDRLCYIGGRAMGALAFEPVENPELESSAEVAVMDLINVAARIVAKHEDFEAVFEENEDTVMNLLSVSTSAGGARAKALLAVHPDTNDVRSGQVKAPPGYGYWIFKFDGVNDERELEETGDIGRMEYAYYLMARDAGIEMAESRLFEESGRAHFMTRRFDRGGNGEKLHMQSLAALNHYPWAQPGLVGYEELFQTVRRLQIGMPAVEQCFRRMVFNVLARNHDDHAKNHAFLMRPDGTWSLAPAYDLTHSFKPGHRYTGNHQMSAAGKRDNFTRDDLVDIGKKFDLRRAADIFASVAEAVGRWRSHAEAANLPEQSVEQYFKTFRKL